MLDKKHIVDLLYQQIRADHSQIILENIEFDSVIPQEIEYLIISGGVDNIFIVLDIMGFPEDKEDEKPNFLRDRIYDSYHKVLENSFDKEEEDIKHDLSLLHDRLIKVLDAYNTNNKPLLDSYLKD